MAIKKELINNKNQNQKKAIYAHKKFIEFITSEVEKKTLKSVLSARRGDELFWLRQHYERVLEFAETSQYKMEPQKVEGTGEDGEFTVKVVIDNGDKTPQEPGNRISKYVTVQGSSRR